MKLEDLKPGRPAFLCKDKTCFMCQNSITDDNITYECMVTPQMNQSYAVCDEIVLEDRLISLKEILSRSISEDLRKKIKYQHDTIEYILNHEHYKTKFDKDNYNAEKVLDEEKDDPEVSFIDECRMAAKLGF